MNREDLNGDLVVTTEMLLLMAKTADAMKLNRRLVTEKLVEDLDPNGVHIVVPVLLHNEVEMRVRILMKMNDTMTPAEGWLDIPLDKTKGVYVNWSDVESHSATVMDELVKVSIAEVEEKLKK